MSRQYGANGACIVRAGTLAIPDPLKITLIYWLLMDSDAPLDYRALWALSGNSGFEYISNETFIDDGQNGVNAVYASPVGGGAPYEKLWDGVVGTQYVQPNNCFDQRTAWTALAVTMDNDNNIQLQISKQNGALLVTNAVMDHDASRAALINYTVGAFIEFQTAGAPTYPGRCGPRYFWTRVLTQAEIVAQLAQIAPISRVGLIDFNPGLDQPPELDFSPLAEDFTYPYSTDVPVSASNPPISWTRGGML